MPLSPPASAALRDALATLGRALARLPVLLDTAAELEAPPDSIEAAATAFRELLKLETKVVVEVQPAALACDGSVVYSDPPRDAGLAARLHQGGVRTLTFHRGLPPSELLALCRVALPEPPGGPGRDDAVTELWRADLAFLAYSAPGGYALQHEGFDAGAVAQAVGRIAARARPLLEGPGVPRRAITDSAPGEGQPLLDEEQLAELDPQSWPELVRRSSLAILKLVEQGFAGSDLERLQETFWRLVDALVLRRETAALTAALEGLRKLDGPAAPGFKQAVGERLAEPARLQRAAELAAHGQAGLTQALPAWIALLPQNAGVALLEVLARAPAAAQPLLARAVLQRADSALERLGAALAKGPPPVALALLGALEGLSPFTRAEFAAPALQHPSPRVRLEAAAGVGGEPELALQLLGPLLQAQESSVRSGVAHVLSGCGGVAEGAAALLIDTMDSHLFDTREREEKAAFHRALGRLACETGFSFLATRLLGHRGEGRGVFRSFRRPPVEEDRLLAVVGLTEDASLRAARALESAAESGQPAALVQAARAALQRRQAQWTNPHPALKGAP